MKILITGGYGFIGSHVADRFNKEGHEVYIVDNLTSGNINNVAFKHTSYILDASDRKCEEVFRTNKFDIVIHLAAKNDAAKALEAPIADFKADMLGLVNMLYLSDKYKIKKFIFASSEAIYEKDSGKVLKEDSMVNPTTLYGLNKRAGEIYCRKWYEFFGISTICFRLSNVYGPRQTAGSRYGLISKNIESILGKSEIVVYGDKNQVIDFIYVEDVADAIYRSINSDITGEYNLSSNTQNTLNKLTEILSKQQTVNNIIYKNEEKVYSLNSCLDNTVIKRALDWVPLYDLSEGISKTYQGCLTNNGATESTNQKKIISNIKNIHKNKYMPYVENLIGFLLVLMISAIFKENLSNNIANYLIFYIVLIGMVYGTKQSVISIVLSSCFFIYNHISLGGDLLSFLYDSVNMFQISLFILIGVAVGYSVDKKENRINDRENDLELLQEKFDFLREIHNETRIVKEQLQSQIVSSEDSFGKVFSLTKQLDSLEPEKVFYSSINIIENVMKTNRVALYVLSRNSFYLRLMAKSNIENFNIPRSVKLDGNEEYNDVVKTGQMFVNKSLDSSLPMMIAPIMEDDSVVAVVALYDVGFDNVTLYYKNLFSIIIGLISSSVGKAFDYEEAMFEKKYIVGTAIMKEEYFKDIINIKSEVKGNMDISYVLLEVNCGNLSTQEMSHVLTNNLRENDYIGMSDNNICVLLSNANEEQAKEVVFRLSNSGINSVIKNEVLI